MTPIPLGSLAPDLRAPGGAITNPAAASTKSGIIVPTVTATDDHGVLGVQWKVDGVNFGAEKLVSPFSGDSLDTRLYNDIAHTISALVRDVVNHTTLLTNGFNINNNPGGGTIGTIDPTGGGRRGYSQVGSFGSPEYIDGTGWSWAGNVSPTHYKVQMRYVFSLNSFSHGFEGINGDFSNHAYALDIGGTDVHEVRNHDSSNPSDVDTGWFDVSNGVTGTIQFRDWADFGVGGTASVGNVTLLYQYVWIG